MHGVRNEWRWCLKTSWFDSDLYDQYVNYILHMLLGQELVQEKSKWIGISKYFHSNDIIHT